MWESIWYGISSAWMWVFTRVDHKINEKSDFERVTVGYDKLAQTLQGRVEGLIKEVDELRVLLHASRKSEDDKRDSADTEIYELKERFIKIKAQLRECVIRDNINKQVIENLKQDVTRHKMEIADLKKRMDEHDSGQMKGLTQ